MSEIATATSPKSPGAELSLLDGLLDPAAYPHHVDQVEVVETHLSWVFLAGAYAYKVKKPIKLSFVDQRDPHRRRELCEEETRLNFRLASGIYLGVRGLARHEGGWKVTATNAPDAEDYAVEMRRFDEADTLASRIAGGTVTTQDVERIGERIARFHSDQAALPATGATGSFLQTVHRNLAELDAYAETGLSARRLAQAQWFAASFAAGRRGLMETRALAGLVRDGHGDMRPEHVVLGKHGVEIIDCLEFDPAMRQTDVGADLAFLAMELEAAGRSDLVEVLLASYRRRGGDPGPPELFAFFVAHRAWVRCTVACLRRRQLAPGDPAAVRLRSKARHLAVLARAAAWRTRGPMTIVVCGGTASGKSFLANHLAQVSGLTHISSDVVRKRQWGLEPLQPAPAAAYSSEANRNVYTDLGRQARAGHGTIVDATFRHLADRQAFVAAYGEDRTPPLFVECRAPLRTVTGRAQARWWSEEPTVSDADPSLVTRQRAEFAPLDEVRAKEHLTVRTDRDITEVVDDITAFLDVRMAEGDASRVSP
ncbi:MAG: bifunctional aminoglycoside phosphotransferase/ATP-binding protein [Candidatus Limnocylindria bacterium]